MLFWLVCQKDCMLLYNSPSLAYVLAWKLSTNIFVRRVGKGKGAEEESKEEGKRRVQKVEKRRREESGEKIPHRQNHNTPRQPACGLTCTCLYGATQLPNRAGDKFPDFPKAGTL